ncbi:hypothetical protein EVAR_66314_1 [Eumeta japonica]|uniref:Uncharacterized protein n=1 Tax=Eumeta variegata TaxID=151549 RepID=A0A4C1ZVU4_EUMVA|nr:hypothetical protein EVAR_66314_1 [Eumeta japonica]
MDMVSVSKGHVSGGTCGASRRVHYGAHNQPSSWRPVHCAPPVAARRRHTPPPPAALLRPAARYGRARQHARATSIPAFIHTSLPSERRRQEGAVQVVGRGERARLPN